MPAARVLDDVAQVFEIAFEHVERAEPVERLHRVIGVADPAVAIVPVALRVGVLGDRGGQRGDDRAGFLVLAQLERDRRSGSPPSCHSSGVARPRTQSLPFVDRVVAASCRARRASVVGEALVGPEEEVQRPLDAEQRARSSIQPTGASVVSRSAMSVEQVADVVASRAVCRGVLLAPATRRAQADADARAARDRVARSARTRPGGRSARCRRKRGQKSITSTRCRADRYGG